MYSKKKIMTKIKLSITIGLIFAVSSIQAQCLLKGSILNEENQRVSNVTIKLLNPDTTFVKGIISDNTGIYTLSDIPSGHYLISYSCIGYIPKYIQLFVNKKIQQLHPVILQTDTVFLNEIEVTASSYIRKKDHVLILPNKQQIKHASTGYDLLANLMIPGIYISPSGKITSLGNNVSLYIDGRKAIFREVQNLRPRDVEKVEYYDVPTGKYAGDFASVNYITKKYKTGGYMAADATQTIGYLKGNYNAIVKLNKGNSDYTLSTGHQMQEIEGIKEVKHEEFYFGNYHIFRDSRIKNSRIKDNNQYAQFYVSNRNDKRTLTGKLSLIRNASPQNYQEISHSYTGSQTYKQHSKTNTRHKSIMPGIYLYGFFFIKKDQQLEVSLNGNYTDNEYTRNYVEKDFESATDVKEDFYNVHVNMNYVISLKRNKSITSKLYHFHRISSSTYTGDYPKWQHLWSGETLYFVEYKQQLSKKTSLRIQPGLSSLQYQLHGEKHISRISPRLQAGLIVQPAQKHFFQIGINIGNSYPEVNTMNRVDQTIDHIQIKRGNVDMDKTNLYATNMAYAIQIGQINTQLAVSYLYANNMPVNNYYVENDKIINSFQDGNGYHECMIYLSSTWKKNSRFNIKLDSYFTRQIINRNFSFSATSFITALNMNYFWKDFAFKAYGVIPYYTIGGFYSLNHKKMHGEYGFSIGWNKKNWKIEAGVNSPFTKNNQIKTWLDTEVYRFNTIRTERANQQTAYLKLAYTFDFGRKTSREQSEVDKTIKSAILKAE